MLTYMEMMQRYASVARLTSTHHHPGACAVPWLSAHWVGLVTPVPRHRSRGLSWSPLRNEVVCAEHDIQAYIPDPPSGLIGFERSGAPRTGKGAEAPTSKLVGPRPPYQGRRRRPGRATLTGPAARCTPMCVRYQSTRAWARCGAILDSIGGRNGWYSLPLAWWARGFIDRAMGGVGLRRGRRNPDRLAVGDTVDFWRVEERVPTT